jgi:hypothetical protein
MFSSSLLLLKPDDNLDEQPPSQILIYLAEIIRDRLAPKDHSRFGYAVELSSLARQVVGSLESFCWNLPSEFDEMLGLIIRRPQMLSILLDKSQPTWLLSQASHLLMLISSYPNNFRHLLSFPTDSDHESEDLSRLPHIESLCSHLIDYSRLGAEASFKLLHFERRLKCDRPNQ